MKYYSDVTKAFYETEKGCRDAEELFFEEEAQRRKLVEEKKLAEKKKQEERASRAKEIEAAYDEMLKSQTKYKNLLSAFVKDYGSYHFSAKSVEDIPYLFQNLFNL